MRSGVSLLDLSFLCTQRKLISTMLFVLLRMLMVAGTAAKPICCCQKTDCSGYIHAFWLSARQVQSFHLALYDLDAKGATLNLAHAMYVLVDPCDCLLVFSLAVSHAAEHIRAEVLALIVSGFRHSAGPALINS